jgi:pimeloyl-ACP methyl ester carboxylesterase
VAAELGLHRPTIIAHSYGGVCSLIASRAMPDRVARAIIIDSALPTQTEKSMIPSGPPRQYPDIDSALARFRLSPPGLWPDPQVLAYIARHSLRQTPQGWTWKFDDSAAETLNLDQTYRDAMLDVRIPCTFIHGALSEIVTPQRLEQVPVMMPLAGRPIAIPACHHHVLIEQPLALVAVLRALLAM